MITKPVSLAIMALAMLLLHSPARAQEEASTAGATAAKSSGGDADEMAAALANPLASLISVPFDTTFDFGYDNDGYRITTNIQPVIPISMNDDWNLIWRTILPVIYQDDVIQGSSQTGLGDTLVSLFFSPAKVTKSGITWGVGPALALPTATDDLLGSEKWGAGPTVVVLRQHGKYTYGGLVNHVWSYAGEDSRDDVSASFLQPFLSVGLGRGYNVTTTSEASYDWKQDQWTIPLNLFGAKVFKAGKQQMQIQLGGAYFVESPDGGPEWGLRAKLTLLFPSG
jgi:hypothetical protein